MKLALAAFGTALVLASGASAMFNPNIDNPRDTASGLVGGSTMGAQIVVNADSYDTSRGAAANHADTVTLSVFAGQGPVETIDRIAR